MYAILRARAYNTSSLLFSALRCSLLLFFVSYLFVSYLFTYFCSCIFSSLLISSLRSSLRFVFCFSPFRVSLRFAFLFVSRFSSLRVSFRFASRFSSLRCSLRFASLTAGGSASGMRATGYCSQWSGQLVFPTLQCVVQCSFNKLNEAVLIHSCSVRVCVARACFLFFCRVRETRRFNLWPTTFTLM